ncbi:MAG: hypothetical protein LKF61_01765 [Eggerthellaceae bacterium]|jgi:hypothetical protein|nr:hypothetical protein [Eggerthellaceae bacterium]MCH4220666.1 hypothetical protein [Eggerthellaceae bacterium]
MKKILLIAPSFFGYYHEIMAELKKRGFVVDFLPDRPSESILFKTLCKLNFGFVQGKIDTYYSEIESTVRTRSYDAIFFLGGMSFCFSKEQMLNLKKSSRAILFIYLWDTLANCKRVADSLSAFDHVFSFERSDCQNSSMKFLPLFYSSVYSEMSPWPASGFVYDACFIGSVHQISKFRNIKYAVDSLRKEGANVYSYYYVPSRSAGLFRRMLHAEYRQADLKYKPLHPEEVANIVSKSKTIIDSPQAGQSGLTMRTIESIGAKRKLLTANSDIQSYDYYQSGNVSIYKLGQHIDSQFVMSPPVDISNDLYDEYSISSWIDTILEVVGTEV